MSLVECRDFLANRLARCYGDALLGAIGLGCANEKTRWNSIVEWVHPDESKRELYDELYALYRELYVATQHCTHALAKIQKDS